MENDAGNATVYTRIDGAVYRLVEDDGKGCSACDLIDRCLAGRARVTPSIGGVAVCAEMSAVWKKEN